MDARPDSEGATTPADAPEDAAPPPAQRPAPRRAVARRTAETAPAPRRPADAPKPPRTAPGAAGHGVVIDFGDDDYLATVRRSARRRRRANLAGFVAMVVAPAMAAAIYLFVIAADQYASTTAFAVRSLDGQLPTPVLDLFGGGADGVSSDSQMLFDYLQSQPLVERMDGAVDLRALWSHPDADPVFRLSDNASIEDLVDHWNWLVSVSYDSGSGVIYVEPRAFTAEDARTIAKAVRSESARLINALSDDARTDAVAFATADLEEAEGRVRRARLAVQTFRRAEGTTDIARDVDATMGLLGALKERRAQLTTEFEVRRGQLDPEGVIMRSLRNQIVALDAQIADEERRISGSDSAAPGATTSLADAIGRQEELLVELEFAENMYTSALTALETARAEARRAQRYLATHIEPTLSQTAQHPRRITLTLAIFVMLLVGWAIVMLVLSNIRDRN
jgi:capsular polysaccharide transport system permease protein